MFTSLLLSALVSGPALEHCRLGAIIFTSEQTGLVSDMCGALFVTSDGGATWERRRSPASSMGTGLQVGALLADGSLLLAGNQSKQVLRSVDGGATWRSVPTPSSQWVYALAHRGSAVWACGSDGLVLRSADFGQSWALTKPAGTNSDDRCVSLSVLDDKRAWVAGWYGHVFETNDGGETWKALAPLPLEPKRAGDRSVNVLVRYDEHLAWVSGPAGTLRTLDGGKTWSPVRVDAMPGVRVVEMPEGGRLLVTSRSADAGPVGWEPVLHSSPVSRGRGAAWLEERSVVRLDEAGRRLVGRVSGPPGRERPRAESIRRMGAMKTAIGERRAFVSEDDGLSWRELSPLPRGEHFADVVLLNEQETLARAADGTFYRATLDGHWSEGPNVALDRSDYARLTGNTVDDPLTCLRPATQGTLTLEFGVQGCFGGDKNRLTLTWTTKGGAMNLELDRQLEQPNPATVRLSAADVARRLVEVRERALRPERPSSCTSTDGYVVSLEVKCEVGGRPRRETLRFESHDCNPSERLQPGEVVDGYARAIGLHEWAAGFVPAGAARAEPRAP